MATIVDGARLTDESKIALANAMFSNAMREFRLSNPERPKFARGSGRPVHCEFDFGDVQNPVEPSPENLELDNE